MHTKDKEPTMSKKELTMFKDTKLTMFISIMYTSSSMLLYHTHD